MAKKHLWNDGWTFRKQVNDKIDDHWEPVSVPHDWLIYQADNLYEDSIGWYRKKFRLVKESGKRYEVYFEGVYMDTTVYVNGIELGEWKYGYSSFFFDMTDLLRADGEENEILVRVVYQSPNSRWYSGAGIYRNVWLIEQPKVHLVTDGIYITPMKQNEDIWSIVVSAEAAGVNGAVEGCADMRIKTKLFSADGHEEIMLTEEQKTESDGTAQAQDSANVVVLKRTDSIRNPKLWSLDAPNLYLCQVELIRHTADGLKQVIDSEQIRIGFRTITFSTEEGCFLNGVHIKINGTAEHHDFGCMGAVFSEAAMRRKIRILKQMGVNSIRTAHNMPAPALLDLADEEGLLVMDEAFDMWERPKTQYDYARFFNEWYSKDIASFVRRDRNHPCILFWSIGNEISDTHADEKRGQELTRMLMEETRKHDPMFHAPITMGSNYMPWENTRKCADLLKYIGYNYAEKYYEAHHAEYPDWYIFGSETASTVQSRGIYHFPYRQSVLADVDEQCSALGNSTTSWGAKSPEACIIAERDCGFSMGQYLWTGFDYIGEPTPYHTRNSYFGQIDTAGFPKDSYYIYQAEWKDYKVCPMIHVFPYWDFNPGQQIDVRVCSNAPIVELLLNGKSLGEYAIDHEKGSQLTGNWIVPYEKGEITAIAYDEDHREIARGSRHSFGEPVRIKASVDRKELYAGCYDVAFVEITIADENGYPVENAVNYMNVEVTGAGWLTGLDNGDSTDESEYKGNGKRLFSGKLLAVIAAGADAGEIQVRVSSEGLEPVTLDLVSKSGKEKEGSSHIPEQLKECGKEPVWARKIELYCETGSRFTDSSREKTVTAAVFPADAMEQELYFEVVNDAGIESHLAKVEFSGNQAKVTALGDGSFRLRCIARNGTARAKVISQLEFTAEGLGQAYFNPYQFIAGGMYTWHEGDAGNGNEHGVSTARDGRTVIGYEGIDFGLFGSDRITLPIFELGSEECPIEIWEGIPGREGSELLLSAVYHKKSIWNTYQEETYCLPRRVKGITTISFVLNQKIHLKGFCFEQPDKARAKLMAGEADRIYGDKYTIDGNFVKDIGNNVTLEYADMDFGAEGVNSITICGKTANDVNSIRISFSDNESEEIQMLEFPRSDEEKEISFTLQSVKGNKTVQFVFLPGCQFDFEWFQFKNN